jgi:hypothetical protein
MGRTVLRGLSRIIVRIVVEAFHRLFLNLVDTFFGFLNWPGKKLRIGIVILNDENAKPVISPNDIDVSIDYASRSFKENFNVKLEAHKALFVGVLQITPPTEVLHLHGGPAALKDEFKTAGNFFAHNLSGVLHPVTVFVVKDIKGASGCSLGPISDYVTLDPGGAKEPSVLAHELAHACGLWHLKNRSNLLYPYKDRDDKVEWWQKNIFRSSRHVTYW